MQKYKPDNNQALSRSLAIGVFDSGMGGLTVLKALRTLLPAESFIYLGDTARLPYGTKSLSTVQQYAMQMAKILVERQIKALIIACNTATTAALPYLQAMLPDIPVQGVVLPGANAAISVTKNNKIAVLATETTIATGAYQRIIQERLPGAIISTRVCSLLVALAEEGLMDHIIAKEALSYYLSDLNEEDTILLGCTHFPVFKPLLTSLFANHVSIVDSALATATALKETLVHTNLENDPNTHSPFIQYLVTDSIERFKRIGELFLAEPIATNQIELINPS